MANIIFAQKSKGAVSIEDFKPLVEETATVEKPVVDLSYKSGNFIIQSSFIEGQSETQGWNVGIDPDSNDVYLFRNTDETLFKRMKFLKGTKPFLRFKSESIDLALTTAGVNKEEPMKLTKVDGVADGLEAYKISSYDVVTPQQEEENTNVEAQDSVPTQEQVEELV